MTSVPRPAPEFDAATETLQRGVMRQKPVRRQEQPVEVSVCNLSFCAGRRSLGRREEGRHGWRGCWSAAMAQSHLHQG